MPTHLRPIAGSTASKRESASSRISKSLGLVERIEPTAHTVPHGDRSSAVIEPWLTDQWYVNAAELAKPAIKAVEDGKTVFVPEELGEDLLRVDAQHPALVHLAPALVGPPNPGVVRAMKTGEFVLGSTVVTAIDAGRVIAHADGRHIRRIKRSRRCGRSVQVLRVQ